MMSLIITIHGVDSGCMVDHGAIALDQTRVRKQSVGLCSMSDVSWKNTFTLHRIPHPVVVDRVFSECNAYKLRLNRE
jgi:hypothetical protein